MKQLYTILLNLYMSAWKLLKYGSAHSFYAVSFLFLILFIVVVYVIVGLFW